MATLSCKCFNISLLLSSSPVSTSDNGWLAEQTGIAKLGEASIKHAPIIELQSLVATRMVSGWKIYKCCNCNVDVCAIDVSDPSRGYVNLELESHDRNHATVIREGDSRFFSPCFRIILEDNSDSSGIGISSKDAHAIDSFNQLQGRVDTFIRAEEGLMEKRIRDFIKKQQEEFNAVKTKANKDRSIIWRKVCKLHQSYGTSETPKPSPTTTASSPSSSTTATSKIASSAPPNIAPIASHASTTTQTIVSKPEQKPTETGWQAGDVVKASIAASNFNLRNSIADGGIFSFDDEDSDVTNVDPTPYRLPTKVQVEEEVEDEEEAAPADPSKYLGASLPIHIAKPSILTSSTSNSTTSNSTTSSRDSKPIHVSFSHQESDKPKRQAPRESWSSQSNLVEEGLPEEVAKSFAVPPSLNRKIKSLI